MPRGDVGPLLLPAPLVAALVASHDALAAQTAFCAASALVLGAVGAERWLSEPATRGRGGSCLERLAAGFLLFGWRAGLAATATTVFIAQIKREARRLRLAQRTVAEITEPVADLPALSPAPQRDLERLRSVGYGVVEHGSSPRLVRYRDVAALPTDALAGRAWWSLGKSAPVINGASALGELDGHPSGDEVWLVQAGDLVVGVLTAASFRRPAVVSRQRRVVPAKPRRARLRGRARPTGSYAAEEPAMSEEEVDAKDTATGAARRGPTYSAQHLPASNSIELRLAS